MPNPLKIQSATTPISLKEMTSAETDYFSYIVCRNFSTLTSGPGTVSINPVDETGLTSLGSINDFEIDTAPAGQIGPSFNNSFSGAFQRFFGGFSGGFFTGFFAASFAINIYGATFTSNYQTFYGGFGGPTYTGNFVGRSNTAVTNYEFFQDLQGVSESLDAYPIYWDTGTEQTREYDSLGFNTDVVDAILDYLVADGVGSYKLQAATPSGGTWTSRDTFVDAASGGDTTYTLWQKTNDTAPTTVRPLKLREINNVYDLIEMTDAEIETWRTRLQNRISATGKGTYAFQASAPGTGTWVKMGTDVTDTEQATYVGTYNGFQGRYVSASKLTNDTQALWVRTA